MEYILRKIKIKILYTHTHDLKGSCVLVTIILFNNIRSEENYANLYCGIHQNKRMYIQNDTCDRLSTLIR